MACKKGCAGRLREAAKEAGWVLLTEGEWAGWWEHPTLSPYRERRFRDVDVERWHSRIALERPSIRKTAFGVIARTVKAEVKEGLGGFLQRMGLKGEMVDEMLKTEVDN